MFEILNMDYYAEPRFQWSFVFEIHLHEYTLIGENIVEQNGLLQQKNNSVICKISAVEDI